MTETFVKSFTHLQGRPRENEALPMLQRVAFLVKLIMRKHGWVLPVLAEFFPDTPELVGLNVNGGQKILLRLRPYRAPTTFYDTEHIVYTMLHELAHNVHGPHNDAFYAFLRSLEDEYRALKRWGYSGEGFHSKGYRLGQGVSRDSPRDAVRQKVLEAAEKRRKAQTVLGRGGRRLGRTPSFGGSGRRALTPSELAAEAAERRARDEKACGSGTVAQLEAAKAAQESAKVKVKAEGTPQNQVDLTNQLDSDDEIIVVDQPPSVPGPSKVAIPQSRALANSTSIGSSTQDNKRLKMESVFGRPQGKE